MARRQLRARPLDRVTGRSSGRAGFPATPADGARPGSRSGRCPTAGLASSLLAYTVYRRMTAARQFSRLGVEAGPHGGSGRRSTRRHHQTVRTSIRRMRALRRSTTVWNVRVSSADRWSGSSWSSSAPLCSVSCSPVVPATTAWTLPLRSISCTPPRSTRWSSRTRSRRSSSTWPRRPSSARPRPTRSRPSSRTRSGDEVWNEVLAAKAANRVTGPADAKVSSDSIWVSLLVNLLPIALLVLLLLFFMSQMQGGGSRVLNFGKSKAKMITKDTPKTTFADVAGAEEAVEELHEIKDFLQNPAKYQALGAKIPKGVLLFGPPGTGKTLLARAVAGEAGVPFYSISGSDFVEMFVGVGASRVRDLFEQAKTNAPAIVFVDEIDAVGRHRGAGMGGGHDEREQTLNQLLVEMDGFDTKGGVILIAATNRPDILDPALLRPGRFDRQIPVDAPDMEGRKAILRVHAKGKPFTPDVDLDAVARRTPGFTGADLANVINESALLTARKEQRAITQRLAGGVDRPGHRRSAAPDPGDERQRKEDHRVPRGWARAGRLGAAARRAGAQGDDPVPWPLAGPHPGAADRGQVHPDPRRDDRHPGVRAGRPGRRGAGLPRADHRRRQRHREGHPAGPRDDHPVRHELEARRDQVRHQRGRAVPRPQHGPRAGLLRLGGRRDRRRDAGADRAGARRGLGDPGRIPGRPGQHRPRADGEGDPLHGRHGPDLRPGGQAPADGPVQRLRQAAALHRAAGAHPGREGQAQGAGPGRRRAGCRRRRPPSNNSDGTH